MTTTVELRCPFGSRRMFGKLVAEFGVPHVTADNLIEFSCPECRRQKRESRPDLVIEAVLHRFDLIGRHIETIEVQAGAAVPKVLNRGVGRTSTR